MQTASKILVMFMSIGSVFCFMDNLISRGVLNFELGTDVRPEVSTTTL